jgi:hypothetical protein
VYKSNGSIDTFEDIVRSGSLIYLGCHVLTSRYLPNLDVFRPLFEVTRDPSTHPELHVFLQRVIGFDTVDDESKTERRYYKKFPYPRLWNTTQSPPYSYWSATGIVLHTAQDLQIIGFITCSPTSPISTIGVESGDSVSLPTPAAVRLGAKLVQKFRHLCPPSTRGRSRRHRSPHVSLPHIALDLPRYPAAQGSRLTIFVLFETDRNCNESAKQQCTILGVREESIEGVFQDGVERQLEHG